MNWDQTVEDLDRLYLKAEKTTGVVYDVLFENDQVRVKLVKKKPKGDRPAGVEVFQVGRHFSGESVTNYLKFTAAARSLTRQRLKTLVNPSDGNGQFLLHRAIVALERGERLPDGRQVHCHHNSHNSLDCRSENLLLVQAIVHNGYHRLAPGWGRGCDPVTGEGDIPPVVGWVTFDWRTRSERSKRVQNRDRYWLSRLAVTMPWTHRDRQFWMAKVLAALESRPDQSMTMGEILKVLEALPNVQKRNRRAVHDGVTALVSANELERVGHGRYRLTDVG